ncbi:hypothetical protein HanRHA438_Chr13g0595431 [Helianthus annuus]|nr:hypothetical protein HanRHA438_Chr13g0595431 [Helianthus annuus]
MVPRRGRQGVMLLLRSLVMASRISKRMPDTTLLSSPMRSSTKPGGNTITIRPFIHTLHHPITTRLHSRPRRL